MLGNKYKKRIAKLIPENYKTIEMFYILVQIFSPFLCVIFSLS